MGIDIWLGLLVLIVLLWGARVNYSRGKGSARRFGRGTLLTSVAISILAYLAFQFVIVKGKIGVDVGGLFWLARALVVSVIFLNLSFSAHLLGNLSSDPHDVTAEHPDNRGDQRHA